MVGARTAWWVACLLVLGAVLPLLHTAALEEETDPGGEDADPGTDGGDDAGTDGGDDAGTDGGDDAGTDAEGDAAESGDGNGDPPGDPPPNPLESKSAPAVPSEPNGMTAAGVPPKSPAERDGDGKETLGDMLKKIQHVPMPNIVEVCPDMKSPPKWWEIAPGWVLSKPDWCPEDVCNDYAALLEVDTTTTTTTTTVPQPAPPPAAAGHSESCRATRQRVAELTNLADKQDALLADLQQGVERLRERVRALRTAQPSPGLHALRLPDLVDLLMAFSSLAPSALPFAP